MKTKSRYKGPKGPRPISAVIKVFPCKFSIILKKKRRVPKNYTAKLMDKYKKELEQGKLVKINQEVPLKEDIARNSYGFEKFKVPNVINFVFLLNNFLLLHRNSLTRIFFLVSHCRNRNFQLRK